MDVLKINDDDDDDDDVKKNLVPIPRQLTDPLVVELTLVKCHQRLVVHPVANIVF